MVKESDSSNAPAARPDYVRRHLRFGWWSLLVFLTLGAVLETMHGLKIGWYLNVAHESRRLMWTLAHAHGTLLSLVHVAFAATVYLHGSVEPGTAAWPGAPSRALRAATLLLPGGFFLGGIFVYGGDPGLGVLLVPVGALLLFGAVFLTARAVGSGRSGRIGAS